MKIALFSAALLILPIIFTACSTQSYKNTIDTAQIVNASVSLTDSYNMVTKIIKKKLRKFPPKDQKILKKINSNLSEMSKIVVAWSKMDNSTVPVSSANLRNIHDIAQSNYALGKKIVEENPQIFTIKESMALKSFDREVSILNEKYQEVLKNPKAVDTSQLVLDALNTGVTLGKILIPILKNM